MDRSAKIVLVLVAVGVALLVLGLMASLAVLAVDWRGFIVLLLVTAVLWVTFKQLRRRLPRRVLLELNIDRAPPEQAPHADAAVVFLPHVLTLRQIVTAVDRAADDPRVAGLLVRLSPVGLTMAQAQELAEAVGRFRKPGKATAVWAPTLGEGHAANAEYYLASAFEEVHLQAGSDVGLIGFSLPQPYARTLLDRLGVVPRLDGRKAYKTARYPLTEHEMPEPARESLAAVLDSLMTQLTRQVAAGRSMEAHAVRTLIDRGPMLDQAAVESGLVDHVSYRDEVDTRLKERLRTEPVPLPRYLSRTAERHRRAPQVALIYGLGVVSRGRHRRRQLMSMPRMGDEDIASALRTAAESDRIKAVVFRIDSPGGSATASETIWRAVKRTRDAGTPVVVSMGSVAGSGGYYIAAPANRIVAQPGTLTGSIGVVSGKLVTRDAWAKLGVNWQTVQAGEQASMWQASEDFSERQWEMLQAMLDAVYERFKERVAQGRNLSAQAVEEVAQGRIWTGEMAKERSLVDDLGGLSRAIEHARELAELPAAQRVQLVEIPSVQRLITLQIHPGVAASTTTALDELAHELQPLTAAFTALDPARDGWLCMPDYL
ncbi:MAG: signal peptide peptidase SppA [Phycisphaeraceae bacterium]